MSDESGADWVDRLLHAIGAVLQVIAVVVFVIMWGCLGLALFFVER